ncbi:MAG: major tail protein [Bacilli bacterium]|nr:major tail protein [Bacilli bacterium]
MANFGLSYPWMAKLDPATGTYSQAFKCGKAINTSVTPSYNETSLFADDQEQESVKEFKNAAVVLGADRLPKEAAVIVFGHTVEEDGTETDNVDDAPNYVGYGFVSSEMVDGVKKYRACVLHKVKFTEGEESFTTKGDSITFGTPTINGTATADSDGNWRTKSGYYTSKEDADEWIQTFLGVSNPDSSNI